jgi:hypothetical protein
MASWLCMPSKGYLNYEDFDRLLDSFNSPSSFSGYSSSANFSIMLYFSSDLRSCTSLFASSCSYYTAEELSYDRSASPPFSSLAYSLISFLR